MFVTQTLTPSGSPGARQPVFCNSIRILEIVRSGNSCDMGVGVLVRVGVGVGVIVKVGVAGVKVITGVCVGVRVGVLVGVPGELVGVTVVVISGARKLNASTSLAERPHVLPSKYKIGE